MSKLTRKRLRQVNQIKTALSMKGYSLRDVDREFKLPKHGAHRALSEPNEAAERAIADVLGVHPMALWKERYDPVTCQRLSPQPLQNYERLPSLKQRRKNAHQQSDDQKTPVVQS